MRIIDEPMRMSDMLIVEKWDYKKGLSKINMGWGNTKRYVNQLSRKNDH